MLIVRHKVKDFAAWKVAFNAQEPARAAASLWNARLFRSADDPNEVAVLLADIDQAKALATSLDLKSDNDSGRRY
jgi:hypothetical protein